MTFLIYGLFALYSALPALPSDLSSAHSSHPISVAADSTGVENLSALQFEDSLQHLYQQIGLERYRLSYDAFRYAVIGYYSLRMQGKLNQKNILSIIDFTKPSREKRFYTIDLDKLAVQFYTYVSHGKNTGEDIAKNFSNIAHSNQSSLGFYITAETYIGSKGYSLKLDGQDKGYNDNMRDRAVVMHDADYVSEYWIKHYGRLGRSQGCPALSKEIAREVIDTIKNRTAVFAYFNDAGYLASSHYLNVNQLLENVSVMARHAQ
ncbi:MAG TPA: murein L,D-transpeptidase catalytic domain family protein [Ohtaekwangia sp.]|uniref:murein L,D-transpeptidase catalytic domain family protein n=1 Tax=Ohtaekwangia sp. TaxID=2066019 RepID=UPI002F95F887